MDIHPLRRRVRHVTLFGKPGCHLCEDARGLLVRLSSRHPMAIEEVDITTDPALFHAYDIRIPVIIIDGQVELDAPIDASKLRRALKRRL